MKLILTDNELKAIKEVKAIESDSETYYNLLETKNFDNLSEREVKDIADDIKKDNTYSEVTDSVKKFY